MKSPNRGRAVPNLSEASVPDRGGRSEAAEPEAEERTGVDRVVRRRLCLVPDLEPRGRGLRDSDRLDGADLDGTAQGNRLPAVRLHLHGQRRRRSRADRAGRQARAGGSCRGPARIAASNRAVGDMPSFTGDRIYVMKDGLSLPFLGGRAGSSSSGGTWPSSSFPKSPRCATSSGWSACPTR